MACSGRELIDEIGGCDRSHERVIEGQRITSNLEGRVERGSLRNSSMKRHSGAQGLVADGGDETNRRL